jgi:hypothetical protein
MKQRVGTSMQKGAKENLQLKAQQQLLSNSLQNSLSNANKQTNKYGEMDHEEKTEECKVASNVLTS